MKSLRNKATFTVSKHDSKRELICVTVEWEDDIEDFAHRVVAVIGDMLTDERKAEGFLLIDEEAG